MRNRLSTRGLSVVFFSVAILSVPIRAAATQPVERREITCVPGAAGCDVQGACATLSIDSSTIYDSHAPLTITVVDPVPSPSDCDGDGVADVPNEPDCNGDGMDDVVVRVVSDAEADGELVILSLVDAANSVYRGTIPTSTKFDAEPVRGYDGTLFLRKDGTGPATITALYRDLDDGKGGPCETSFDPSLDSWIRASATVSVPAGRIIVKGYLLVDDGDGDNYADTNETVQMYITVRNKTGVELTAFTARLFTDDLKLACILDSTAEFFGSVPDGEEVTLGDPFVFQVADAPAGDRVSLGLLPLDDFSVKLDIAIGSDRFWMTHEPQSIVLDLDLDTDNFGQPPTSFDEGFDVPSLASTRFSPMSLDAGITNNAQSENFRCQYSDPGSPKSNRPGEQFCHLGFANPADNGFDWQINGPSSSVQRTFRGSGSLFYGVGLGAGATTTRLSQLDAVVSDPINLDTDSLPELSFKHQVSLADSRVYPIPAGEALDRAVVQVQEVDPVGSPVGDWTTIEPWYNCYDVQPTAASMQCMFDPIDDGSIEDEFFGTSNPFERFGPSSTCYRQQVFGFQGDTSLDPFSEISLGRAIDGPGLAGSIGPGTWVETRFNLQRYRGKRIRIRFLVSTHKIADLVLQSPDAGLPDTEVADDGWYIDDVTVTGVLFNPAGVTHDNSANPDPSACRPCVDVVAMLTTQKQLPAVPGERVELTAEGSLAGSCLDGTLQYEFWIDNGNGVRDASDVVIRPFTDDPTHTVTPTLDRTYGATVRCSSVPGCDGDDSQHAFLHVTVIAAHATKMLLPTGCGPGGSLIAPGGRLTYRIDYQNPSNQVVTRVYIEDTFDPNLQLNLGDLLFSLNPRPCPFTASLTGRTIGLSYSSSSNPCVPLPVGGQGFVEFSINAAGNVAGGTAIMNSATIRFEAGSQVVGTVQTNTTVNFVAADNDGDGVSVCTDCNDNNAAVFPGNPEVCDHLDNDCDGTSDDGFDVDMDGLTSCALPVADCDDDNVLVYPGAPEICDGVDNDCNGLADIDIEGSCTTGLLGECMADGTRTCTNGIDFCRPTVGPLPEICNNNEDDDCDGVEDEVDDTDNDGVDNCIDNCIAAYNPGQEDTMFPGGPGDACVPCTEPPPAEVPQTVSLNKGPAGRTEIVWDGAGASGHNVYRGFLTPGNAFDYNQQCLDDECVVDAYRCRFTRTDCSPATGAPCDTSTPSPGPGNVCLKDSCLLGLNDCETNGELDCAQAPVDVCVEVAVGTFTCRYGLNDCSTNGDADCQAYLATDPTTPNPSTLFFYLVSGTNCPGGSMEGTLGSGTPGPRENRFGCPAANRDLDVDGIEDVLDNCPPDLSGASQILIPNTDQANADGDARGDLCDNCPADDNNSQSNIDADALGDVCDDCTDSDGDGYGNFSCPDGACPNDYGGVACELTPDNCPDVPNLDQNDNDADGVGNVCDNCAVAFNPGQEDGERAEGPDGMCTTVGNNNPELYGPNCLCDGNVPGSDDLVGDGLGDNTVCDPDSGDYNGAPVQCP